MFRVRTDEDFFNKFKELEVMLKRISANFQNGDTEATHEQWEEYLAEVSDFREMFDEVIHEADSRFELV
ncbi:hypothetical protein CHH83_02130 [Bacillus sp. 7586-K]|nr:hypothetical protein CHH83_02130 [Bacillus sp. 7586-K]